MNIENTMLIMKQFEEIQNEMKKIGEIDWITNLEDNTCLASFYFREKGKSIESNETIFKCIEKLKKTFKIEALSIGKTVTIFLKERSNECGINSKKAL